MTPNPLPDLFNAALDTLEALAPEAGAPAAPAPLPAFDTSGPEPVVTHKRQARRERRPGDLGADSMAQRWAEFDARHPEVWEAILRFADEALDAGARRFGMRAIIERVRWERLVTPDALEAYAINNNYAGFYARKLVATGEQYAAALELREGRHVGE